MIRMLLMSSFLSKENISVQNLCSHEAILSAYNSYEPVDTQLGFRPGPARSLERSALQTL